MNRHPKGTIKRYLVWYPLIHLEISGKMCSTLCVGSVGEDLQKIPQIGFVALILCEYKQKPDNKNPAF